MIADLSRTLEALLTQAGLPPELSLAQIAFEAPVPPAAPPSQTTIFLFLHDIQENTELRSNEPVLERNGNQVIRKQPPARVACSYLITAWPIGGVALPLQEHRLLSQVYQTFARFPTIPAAFLTGSLVGQEPLPPLTVAVGDDLKHTAEFWTALGGRLRAALRVTVTISVPVLADSVSFMVTAKSTRFAPGLGPDDLAAADTLVQVGGRVRSAGGADIEGAIVDILDAGLRTRTRSDGRFEFPLVPAGSRTFRAIATGFQPTTQVRPVPGRPDDYEFQLTP